MNLVKTFDTSGMDSFLFQILIESGSFVEDGVGIYHVGGFVQEYEDSWVYLVLAVVVLVVLNM